MSKKLLLFAHPNEARETISRLSANENEKGVYHFDRGIIAVAGMGCFAVMTSLIRFFPQVEEIWNLGFAGVLSNPLPIGTILPISKVGKHLFLPALDVTSFNISTNNHPSITLRSDGSKLITVDCPIHDESIKESLKQNWDLVDMEGYAIAYATSHLGKKCRMWKIVSDFASQRGREYILQHQSTLSSLLADHIEMMLN